MIDSIKKPSAGSAARCGKVAVLLGGTSAEREVSLNSGNAVYQALVEAGVDAFKLDVQSNVLEQLQSMKADRVFNVLHGRGGEDGTIQAVLELLNMPYTGSGICASALAMNKLATKRIFAGSGIPTPDYMELASEADCERLLNEIGLPVFVKPVLEGSSIGMTPVHKAEDLIPAWNKARAYGNVFAEKFIQGVEYTAGFLGGQVLPLIKLETPHEFYDYDAKYLADDTIYTCPCGLPEDRIEEINDLVERSIRATGVRHWGRVDLMLDDQGQPWVIEVNTVPGMTDHSLVPMAARQAGLEMPDLVLRILELTLEGDENHV
ncbi:MAG: D-alanine--D-alanine ligase [Gammaproteobacteria bacterium]|nr:D-alanine--D-alanine ligase [Gammaproteobacteria bacterium]